MRPGATWALILVLGGSADAKTGLQGTVEFLGGYAATSGQDATNRAHGYRGDLRPGLTLFTSHGRIAQRLRGRLLLSLIGDVNPRTPGTGVGGAVDWAAEMTLSPRVSAIANLSTAIARLGGINTLADSSQTVAGAMLNRTDAIVTFQGGASFLLGIELTPRWRLGESTSFGTFLPVQNDASIPKSYTVSEQVGLEHTWQQNAFGGHVNLAYNDFSSAVSTTADNMSTCIQPHRRQLVGTMLTGWRRDWGRFFATEIGAGPLFVTQFETPNDPPCIAPVRETRPNWAGNAAFRYTRDEIALSLSYAHTALPNLFAGQTFIIDQVGLSASIPFPGKPVGIGFGAGYQYAQQVYSQPVVDPVTMMQTLPEPGTAHIGFADGSVWWAPRDEIRLAVRYQFFIQEPTRQGAMPATPQAATLQRIERHLALLAVEGTFPHERRAILRGRPASRVDGTW